MNIPLVSNRLLVSLYILRPIHTATTEANQRGHSADYSTPLLRANGKLTFSNGENKRRTTLKDADRVAYGYYTNSGEVSVGGV